MQEKRLKWSGHVMRREDECVGERLAGMDVGRGEEEERKAKVAMDGHDQG